MAHRMDIVIEKAMLRILSHQQADGSFGYWCEVTPMSEAVMVIFLHLIGESQHPVIGPLCASIRKRQQETGAWTLYPDQTADLSLTTLAYFALLLSGEPKQAPRMRDAERIILHHGGLLQTSTFAKVLLAAAGQLPWSVIPVPPLSLISFDPSKPVNLFDVTAPARIHLPSILILSHRQYAVRLPSEMTLAHLVHPEHQPPNISIAYPNPSAMEQSKSFLLERMEPDGTWAGYLSATVLASLALRALGFQSTDKLIKKSIHGLMGLLVMNSPQTKVGSSVHQQFFTSTVWDTSLSMQALQTAGLSIFHPAMQHAASYLISKQQTRLSDWQYNTPGTVPGGWGFSSDNTLYPDVDDTLSALKALYPYKRQGWWRSEWERGANWLLAMQNDDGGWSPFDRNCNKPYLPLFAPDDLKDTVLDPSTPDITARVLDALGCTGILKSTRHRPLTVTYAKISNKAERAKAWLLSQQHPNGSWFGRWGITYIYGTTAAIQGLRWAGVSRGHTALQRAVSWLTEIQRGDGGFGESCQSDEQKTYVPLRTSTASQTAWALMGMCSATRELTPPIRKAVGYLLDTACEDGGWQEVYPTGSGVTGQVYLRYHSYPVVWPLMALCVVRRKFGSEL
ncbi:prenyltransferase/squalene oxidase repeat-containing protein [Alicyclobacillus mengziensis]|uniref:Sporulenol synthase n=1 Tax=Alicyclobacillus mengziensis TaxID=2931921 RepID=A0A9X7Z8W8_9BACL|nr:prenyltransferase/squalene oxidase repeat-containing protein [Alicyclobacillus mengziensis]QSO48843.1 hypothetical protein JZ786_07805 [Alicyclobacillus mengziensis]